MTTITLYQNPKTGEKFSTIKDAADSLGLSYGYLRNQLHYSDGHPLKCANPPLIKVIIEV